MSHAHPSGRQPSDGSSYWWPRSVLVFGRLALRRFRAVGDGQLIDLWHLAAVSQGFRLRKDDRLARIESGIIVDAARHVVERCQWLVRSDFDQKGDTK